MEITDAIRKSGGLLHMMKPESSSLGISENAASILFSFAVISGDKKVNIAGGGKCFIECRYFSIAGLYPVKDLSCELSINNNNYILSGKAEKESHHIECMYSRNSEKLGLLSSVDRHLNSWEFRHDDGRILRLRENHEKVFGIMPVPIAEIFVNEKLFINIDETLCKKPNEYVPFLRIIDSSFLGDLIDDDLIALILMQHFAYSALHFRRSIVN